MRPGRWNPGLDNAAFPTSTALSWAIRPGRRRFFKHARICSAEENSVKQLRGEVQARSLAPF